MIVGSGTQHALAWLWCFQVREELLREVATLRRDVEEQALRKLRKMFGGSYQMKGVMSSDSAYWLERQVREDLRKQLVSLGQDCSVSIEAQVKDSSAEISHHLERHLEARL